MNSYAIPRYAIINNDCDVTAGRPSVKTPPKNTPKGLLHDLGPEDLLLVQVDSAETVPHLVWPRVRRDVFGLSCAEKKREGAAGR